MQSQTHVETIDGLTRSKDGRTCSLPVVLNPNHEYKLGLNSLSHNNFQSKWGVPLKPVIYKFKTGP